MLSERTIINALILAAGLIIGPYLTIATFEHNDWPITIAGGITFLLIVFFYVGNSICALPLLGLSFSGNLNFLPFGLDMGNVCTFTTILYYVVAYVTLRQKWFKTGPRAFFYPIVIIGLIMLYHQRTFGLRIIGGATEGSRPAILLLACVMTYFCGINIPSPSVAFLRRIPLYALAVTVISNLPFLISTYVPQSASALFYLSTNVNIGAYLGDQLARAGGGAAVGSALQLVLLAYFPIYNWWRPGKWWVLFLSLVCFWFVAQGGFRSGMVVYLISFATGVWCHCSWRSLILLPVFLVGILALDLAHSSNLITLPFSVQRSISFLPGNWDKDVQDSDVDSNTFRSDMQRIYRQEYAAKSPILGNGFIIDVNQLNEDMDKQGDAYYGIKCFLDAKAFHVGWISVYDAVGIVGMVAFIWLGLSVIYLSGCEVFTSGQKRRSPLLPLNIWLFCLSIQNMFGYFTVFGSFPATFNMLCAYAIILAQERSLGLRSELSTARTPEHELFGLPKFGAHWPVEPAKEPNR